MVDCIQGHPPQRGPVNDEAAASLPESTEPTHATRAVGFGAKIKRRSRSNRRVGISGSIFTARRNRAKRMIEVETSKPKILPGHDVDGEYIRWHREQAFTHWPAACLRRLEHFRHCSRSVPLRRRTCHNRSRKNGMSAVASGCAQCCQACSAIFSRAARSVIMIEPSEI